jgi:hypothetical protein
VTIHAFVRRLSWIASYLAMTGPGGGGDGTGGVAVLFGAGDAGDGLRDRTRLDGESAVATP